MAATLEGVLNQFRDRDMPDIGITDLRADGKKHLYGPKRKAWFRLFEYVSPKTGTVWVSGVFGHKDEHWKVEREELADTMTPEEREAARAEWARKQREHEQKQARVHAMAAGRARDQWNKSARTGQSPYLVRKQVALAESARFMTLPDWENWLIIPLIRYDEGRMVGVQKIAPEKPASGPDKLFTKGFEKSGSACRLGDEPMDGDLILLAEGYATAATGREGVGYEHPVYMALDSGNLPAVARILRAKYPTSPMLVLADDDYLPKKNGDDNQAGEKKSRQAVQEVGNAAMVLPRFTAARRVSDDDESLPKLTDFNDLHCAEGIEPVRVQLTAAIDALLRPVASPAPTQDDDVAAPTPVATDTRAGGAGVDADKDKLSGMMAEQLYRHFALVEGKTRVIDQRFGTEYALPALRAKFGKKTVDEWMEKPTKLLISQAEVSAAKKAREEAEKKDDAQLLAKMERYVYLDGSTSIWDAQLQEMIPQGAAKLAMGSYFDVWVDSPERKIVPLSNVRFAPGVELPADRYINLFSGMDMEPWYPAPKEQLPRKLWDLIPLFKRCENIVALAYHLCDGRNDVFEWLLNWIAYPLQHVGAKMDTAVLVHGSVHGSGKSMFFERCVKPLYGRYSITLGQDQLESQYTGSRSARLFLLFEEVISSKQRYSQTGKVKHMITGLTQVIEKKFMNAWEEANCANCVFLSNAIQPIHVEAYDRRFQVIWPIETAMDEVYGAVDREISEGGLEAFLGLLKALPLTLTEGLDEPVKFDPHTKPLMTEEKRRLIRYGLSGWELFVYMWEAGEIGGIPFVSCLTEDLYAVYRRWCESDGESSVISFNKFSLNVSVYDMRKLTKKVAWWRWAGMAKSGQNTVFKVGREPSGVAEQDYLGNHIGQFKQAAREYGVTLRGDL